MLVDEVLVDEVLVDRVLVNRVLVGSALVDELVTGNTMVTLELLLILGVVEIIEEFETGVMALIFELVMTAEELVAEEMVFEIDLEAVELTDESVTGRTISELDALFRLDLVEMTDEFEIGYKTLRERVPLLEPEMRLVIIPAELVGTPEPAGEDDLVDAEGTVDTESGVDEDVTVAAEEDADTDGLITADEDADAEELINVEELPDGLDTAGLKMTVAKMRPEASLRLDRSNRLRGRHEERSSSKEAATQFCWAEHLARHFSRAAGSSDKPVA